MKLSGYAFMRYPYPAKRYPAVEELTSRGIPEDEWDWFFDEDEILAEIRLIRYDIHVEKGGDRELEKRAYQAHCYATGPVGTDIDGVVHKDEPPEDLTGLFPDPEKFISEVKSCRSMDAVHVADLDAYNDDARRRAVRLGFPPESFVLKKEEIDYRGFEEIMAQLRARGLAD
jgi:hypothetical protein